MLKKNNSRKNNAVIFFSALIIFIMLLIYANIGLVVSTSLLKTDSNQNLTISRLDNSKIPIPQAALNKNHHVISLNSNSELDAYFSGNSTNGNSWGSAYVIEDLIFENITETPAIKINGTSKYIIIRNSVFNSVYAAIYLLDCSNVRIENITVTNSEFSLYAQRVNNSIFVNNKINNNKNGIILESSDLNHITGNNCSYNLINGIHLAFSNNNTINSNNASFNMYYGLYFYDSRNNTASNNYFGGNAQKGILVQWKTAGDRINYFESNTINNEGAPSIPGTIPGYDLPVLLTAAIFSVLFMCNAVRKKIEK